ncbi:MAG: hypothetical protein AAF541_01015 [Pseudomonadota bacterium]
MQKAIVATLLLAFSQVGYAERIKSNLDLTVGYSYGDSQLRPWTDAGDGKLLWDAGELDVDGFSELEIAIRDTVSVAVIGELNSKQLGPLLGITEAFVQWRPVPRSPLRSEFRIGTFYPPISLENRQQGWRNAHTRANSAINTWIAEEVRVLGAEWTGSLRTNLWGGDHRLKFRLSAFYNNDSAGALLTWRGWSLHNRQSTLGDELKLPVLPVFEPGAPFAAQASSSDPFVEVDDSPGVYAGVEWQLGRSLTVNALWYDNKADPEVLEGGHYGWETVFKTVGVATTVTGIDLVAQWMEGSTAMGPIVGGARAAENKFSSYFLLAAREFMNHHLAVRYDWFSVDDIDSMAVDPNQERGHGFTASYRYKISPRTSLTIEHLQVESQRDVLADTVRERSWHVGIRYAFISK